MSADAIWLVIAVVAGALALSAWVWRERFIQRMRQRAASPARRKGRPSSATRRRTT